jgi:diguanylate cyclase (GGDEF)-like protein/PAS domain S-box-containing protein
MPTATVLLIDANREDEQLFREELALIRDQPFQLEVARSLTEGLARIKQPGLDVIVLDLNLPDSLGLTTFLRVQPKAGHHPIIALVGQVDEDLGVEAVERGALDYLIKQQVVSNLLNKALRYATERTHTLLALKASETRYRELYENVVAGVFQTTPDGKFMAANPALVRLLGYESEDELLELSIARDLYLYAEERDNWLNSMSVAGELRNAELTLKRKDGRKIVVLENSRAVRDEHGKVIYYEGTLTDITEAHELSRQLSYEASHDALSGLINRREFEIRLQRALDSVQATGSSHAVCYLDLDQFKIINDTCGHIAGDELLRQLAQVLQGRVRSNDTLARLGGDEFGLLLHDCAIEDAIAVAEGLLKAVEQHQFVWGANTFSVGASIGLVPVSANFRRITQVLQAADAACYAAKDQGRNRVHVYQEDDTVVAQRHGEMQWVARVKRALTENRFFLEAQPIVSIQGDDHGLPHYELLVRMRDESGRVVPPGAFLPAVERYNLSQRLDRWVIATALGWLAANRAQTERIARVFVNLSGDSVGDAQLQEFIRTQMAEARIEPTKLGFEITETAAIGNLTRANQLIGDLRKLGCAFSLDDFGSGVSSFAYLKALTVDFLKIDGLFIGNIVNDRIDFEMVRSITDIGHVMGKKVVAESVENINVLAKLREIGVDYVQGYAVGAPTALDLIGTDLSSAGAVPGRETGISTQADTH